MSPCVLVTRAKHQAQSLMQQLTQAGVQAVLFPTLDIIGLESQPTIQDADCFIFTSSNAVRHAKPDLFSVAKHRLVLAIGDTTAQCLQQQGIDVYVHTQQMNSEGLLALPVLQQCQGQKIVIVTGEGGRDVLITGLQQRGAEVMRVNVYRRAQPKVSLPAVKKLKNQPIHIIIITSVSTFDNLIAILGEQAHTWLQDKQFIAFSQRIAERISAFGVNQPPLVTRVPSDQAIIECLKQLIGNRDGKNQI